jgi:hypothetical protein
MPYQNKSITLMELLIALVLMGLVILGINSITIFSRYQLISLDRRIKVQNDLSFCLDHIAKRGLSTIGNEKVFGEKTAVVIETDTSLALYIDAPRSSLGIRDVNDYWIKYTFDKSSNRLLYCSNCGASSACLNCREEGKEEVLSGIITSFKPGKNFSEGNYVYVKISGRWDPSKEKDSVDNPEVIMRSTIYLPSVSTN